ncbi:MAG: PEGA domain-containing protein [Deltaproteobacteria bacterium]|nr:PEGA domain-containing protein [Deltaproteobacteria bacterium]
MTRALAFVVSLSIAPWAAAEPVVLVGEGADLAPALSARGVEVVLPGEASSRLQALAARGRGEIEAARALAAEGRRAYRDADFSAAADRLARAAQAYLATGLGGVPLAELAQLHLDVGLSYLAAGSRHQAEREIGLALRLAPDLAVDRTTVGPPIRRTVEQIRTTLPRTGSGTTTIATTPQGATIQIDGALRGSSPVTLSDLAEGAHLVTATLAGHGRAARRIEVDGPRRGLPPLRLTLVPASDAQRSLDALEAGDAEEAARRARQALGVASVIAVVRSGSTRTATRAFGTQTRTARGTVGSDLVRQLYGEGAPAASAGSASAPPVDLAVRADPGAPADDGAGAVPATPPAARPREGGGGLPWWAWAGGAVIVVAGTATAIALLAGPAEPDERILVPEQ